MLLSQRILDIEICLDQVASRIPGFLSTKLGLYNSSLSHAINKLIDENLVEKKAIATARATWGITQKNTVAWTGKIPRCLTEHRDLILIHDLGNCLHTNDARDLLQPGDHLERLHTPSGIRNKVMLSLLFQARRMAHLLSGAGGLKVGGEQLDR